MEGWIKLYRKFYQWEWFTESHMVRFFIYLLCRASYNEYSFRGVPLKPGQLPFGLHKASLESGLSVQNIRTCVDKLKSTNEITIKTSTKGSIITIVRWIEYQEELDDQQANQQANQQTINKRSTTTKKIRKEEKNIYTSTRLEIIKYLNLKTGKNFKSESIKAKSNIDARLKEGYSIEDLKRVVDIKCDEWLHDVKQCKFLRPETLFGNKFDGYLNTVTKNDLERGIEKELEAFLEN